MGQKHSETFKNDNIDLDNWVQAVQDPMYFIFVGVNPFRKRLLLNKNTRELIEEYQLQFLNQEDFTSYSKDIEARKEEASKKRIQILANTQNQPYRTCPYIYKVKYFTNTSVDQLCSTIYNGLLYMSKVELRLKEINDIPLNDQLYLYQCCLQGFKVLYEQVGYFDITEQMIFFTQTGKVKVWMNPNLSKHHPNYDPTASNNINNIENQGSQSQMLRNLINLIEQNTDLMTGDRPLHFRQYLKEKGIIDRLSFYKAIDEFHRYLQENALSVNNYMKSIYDLFHNEQEHNDSLYKSQSNKSQVQRMRVNKDYDSLKNSSHQLSFQKVNKVNYDRLVPQKSDHPTPLDASRASKNSYNSQYNTKNKDSYSNLPKVKESSVHRSSQASQKGYAYQAQSNGHQPFYPNLPKTTTVFNKPTNRPEVNRGITFGPPQRRVFQNESLITKYRSLQKAPVFGASQNRPITFSYQNQQSNVNHTVAPLQNMQVLQLKQRKQSIIDKLKSPAMIHTANTINNIKTKKYSPIGEYLSRTQTENATSSKKVNYFSTTEAFMLDSEIAEDMMKYLGFNPNQI